MISKNCSVLRSAERRAICWPFTVRRPSNTDTEKSAPTLGEPPDREKIYSFTIRAECECVCVWFCGPYGLNLQLHRMCIGRTRYQAFVAQAVEWSGDKRVNEQQQQKITNSHSGRWNECVKFVGIRTILTTRAVRTVASYHIAHSNTENAHACIHTHTSIHNYN